MFLPHISLLKCLILRELSNNHCAQSGSWQRLKNIYTDKGSQGWEVRETAGRFKGNVPSAAETDSSPGRGWMRDKRLCVRWRNMPKMIRNAAVTEHELSWCLVCPGYKDIQHVCLGEQAQWLLLPVSFTPLNSLQVRTLHASHSAIPKLLWLLFLALLLQVLLISSHFSLRQPSYYWQMTWTIYL